MRYTLSVNIRLQEIPEPDEPPELKPGEDPLKQMVGVFTALAPPRGVIAIPREPTGVSFTKSVAVSVEKFGSLAQILEQFDNLTTEIGLERP